MRGEHSHHGATGAAGSTAGVDTRIGALVGEKYRVERRLGAGAMGVVYAAVNTWTGRAVALKFPLAGRADGGTASASQVERFMREARAASRIEHPHAVAVLDLGRDGEGEVFLVQELLEGETLAARIARGPLGLDEARALLLPAMEALELAHANGVIHRDLKPDNLFIARRDGALALKVLDFGVARLTDADPDARLTVDGSCVGTPAFMSPEQCRGGELDHRADVWSMALVWCEALTGARVFAAPSANETVARVLTERVTLRLPGVAPAVTAALQRALSRDPDDRWPSMSAFAEALRGASARPAPRAAPRRAAAALVVLVALALSALAASRSSPASPAAPPPRRAAPVAGVRAPAAPAPAAPAPRPAVAAPPSPPRPRPRARAVEAPPRPAPVRANQAPILEL